MARRKRRNKNSKLIIFLTLLILALYLRYGEYIRNSLAFDVKRILRIEKSYNLGEIPEYSGKPYVIINNNVPFFDDLAHTDKSFEVYSNLDKLGRCGEAYANIGVDLMPTDPRERIGSIKPSGWHTVKYSIITDGKYLYNRCHLIAYQLTAENANPKNLITCTRYANTVGMMDFENMVANYIKRTKNHVLYRVTPIFKGSNLVASGIEMEALSIEDNGRGIKFNIYVYNVQPGISINYKNGRSKLNE